LKTDNDRGRFSPAFTVSFSYFVVAGLWILCSDSLMANLVPDRSTLIYLSQFKGLIFVSVTSVALYFTVSKSFGQLERARNREKSEKEILEMMATDESLELILDSIQEFVEWELAEVGCAIHLQEEAPEESSSEEDIPIWSADGKRRLGVLSLSRSLDDAPSGSTSEPTDLATSLCAIAIERAENKKALLRTNQALEEKIRARTRDLKEALQQAREADRIKSSFLATMSHELRTPLNSIIGFTGILRQELPGPLNPEQKKQLGLVQHSSQHLLELINDVLDLSKIEAGQLTVRKEPFSLPGLLSSLHQTLEPSARAKGLEFKFSLPPGPLILESDERRVRQILLNLLNNAIKFTRKGAVNLTVAQEGEVLQISVEDTGPGIQEDDLESIFQPFSQAESGLTRHHEGTGLGLTISLRLVELLDGSLDVESRIGVGSVFRVRFPINSREEMYC